MELFIVIATVYALVLMYRSVKARERIADAVEAYVDEAAPDSYNYQRANAIQRKMYKEFLYEVPEASDLTPKDRHERFRAWTARKVGE